MNEGINLPTVLGSAEGIVALAKFLEQSGALTESGDEARAKTPEVMEPTIVDEEGDSDSDEVGEVEHPDDEDAPAIDLTVTRPIFAQIYYPTSCILKVDRGATRRGAFDKQTRLPPMLGYFLTQLRVVGLMYHCQLYCFAIFARWLILCGVLPSPAS